MEIETNDDPSYIIQGMKKENMWNDENKKKDEEAERIKNELDPYELLLNIKKEIKYEELPRIEANSNGFIPATTSTLSWESICGEVSDADEEGGEEAFGCISKNQSGGGFLDDLEEEHISKACRYSIEENIIFLEEYGGKDSMQVTFQSPPPIIMKYL